MLEIGPGVRMIRDGRIIYTENRRTEAEQREFVENLRRARQETLAGIGEKVFRFRRLFQQGSPLPILANLTLESAVHNLETYKEYDSGPSSVYVEWATWIAVTNGSTAPDPNAPISPKHFIEARELLHEIVSERMFLIQTAFLDQGRDAPDAKDEFLAHARTQHLFVRNPAYSQHLGSTLDSLFRPLSHQIASLTGATWDNIRAFVSGMGKIVNTRLHTLRTLQQSELQTARNLLKRKNGLENESLELANRLRELRTQGISDDEILNGMINLFFYGMFHHSFGCKAVEVAEACGLTEVTAAAMPCVTLHVLWHSVQMKRLSFHEWMPRLP